jgi:hypothetical protein
MTTPASGFGWFGTNRQNLQNYRIFGRAAASAQRLSQRRRDTEEGAKRDSGQRAYGRAHRPRMAQVSAAKRRYRDSMVGMPGPWRPKFQLRSSVSAGDAMAALPRKSDPGGAASLPWQTIALPRDCCSGVSMSAGGDSDSAVIDSRYKPARQRAIRGDSCYSWFKGIHAGCAQGGFAHR